MVHTQNTELLLSRPSLKGFFWLGFFVFHLSTSGIVQMKTVKAKVGEVATLPCDFNPHLHNPPKHYSVYWQRAVGFGHTDQVAISYWNGKRDIQDEHFMNRTTMDRQNFTLWIFPVKVSDEGRYKCIIFNDTTQTTELDLSVVADFSKPAIHADPPVATCGSTSLILTCSSHGGYPAPTMSGLLNNNKVECNHTFTFDNQTGLINITSSLQRNVTEDIFFQCSVSYPGFQVSTSFNYTIPKECRVEKSSSHWIMIASSVSIVCIVVVAAVANIQCFKRHRSLCRTRSHQPVSRSEVNTGAALIPLQFSKRTSEQ